MQQDHSAQRTDTSAPGTQTKHISFSRELFHGRILGELVLPFPTLNEADLETQRLFGQTLEKIVKLYDVERVETEKRLPNEFLNELKSNGFFGLIIPTEYGGLGLSNTNYVQILSNFGLTDPSIVATVGAHQSIGLKALLMFGDPSQKEKFLPKLATGEMLAAFALTEPDAGSDAQSIRSRAELSRDGTYYLLNGNKIWITNGGIADFFTVFAKTTVTLSSGEKKDKVTCFIVTRDMAGFSSGPEEKKLGLVGSSTTSLHFENVRVPVENVIGDVGGGFKIAMSVLNNGRLGLASACAIGTRNLLQRSIEHALQRKQFGRPISDFGLIQSKIATLAIDAFAAEAMVRVTAHLMDNTDHDYSLETAMCKVFCTELEWRAINEAIQIAGGMGYMKEFGYEKILRDSRVFSIWEGANEVLKLFIGLSGIQAPGEHLQGVYSAFRSPFHDVFHSIELLGDFGVTWIRRRVGGGVQFRGVHPQFNRETDTLEKYTNLFATAVEATLLRHGQSVIHNEFTIRRFAEIATDLFAMACTLSRGTAILAQPTDPRSTTDIATVRAFCRKARRRLAENLRRLRHNDDQLEIGIAKGLYQVPGWTQHGVFLPS